VGLGVESPSCFPKRFWHAAFGLFLWGRAQKLRPVLEEELRRRLPPNVILHGPRVRARSDVIAESASTTAADTVLGPTNMLRAEVQCKDKDVLRAAFEALCSNPPNLLGSRFVPTTRKVGESQVDSNSMSEVAAEEDEEDNNFIEYGRSLDILHVMNGFHVDKQYDVFPTTAGVLLTVRVGGCPTLEGIPMYQLAEVELILDVTLEARWLADVMDLKPPPPPVVDTGPKVGAKFL